ncbi:penicillin acylase family protein [Facklamia miroungae]|uniref:Penicillin amidase n=1 Tax=Facklamia miroungae TaxID=120956 RepID=A0A1G7PVE1_9LACT|nr:penicillin acylase family protein [Facklamia miroungae]NKZ28844.1 penicillin acylase family protein [Facklamia miroungae]SDF90224.1 penicillin amidase [Facklamia miroungae]
MKKKLLKNIFISLVLLAGVVFAFLYFTVQSSKAKLDGDLQINGISQPVTVTRDAVGIPTLIAKNDQDLYFAQGFIQAQDRLFQMDMARRQASGRLSEVVGEAAIENDKKFLLFDLRRAAERSLAAYSDETLAVIESFTKGVNEYIHYAKENNKLPYEFKMLGYQPEEWSVVDSLTIGKYMAYDLGGHFDYQAFNNWALNDLGEELFVELNEEAITKDKDIEEIITVNKKYQVGVSKKMASLDLPNVYNGSNNWVLSGAKTETGQPILADDPHLTLSTPSIWYQMVLKSPSQKVSGVIFTGIPGIILGNNENIAWGVTNYGPDVQDLFIEKRNPNDLSQFELDGKYYDSEVVEHEIKVKGKDSISFNIEYSKNGIIVDDLVKIKNSNTSVSMKWTAHEPSTELDAILALNKAENWQEFEEGLLNFTTPAQNFVYADKAGNIGMKSNGNIPIRKKGNGILLVPGYDSSYGWDGYVAFDKLPKQFNPKKGYLATANVQTDENLAYHTSNIYAEPYRMDRIDQVLSQDKQFTTQDMKDLQMDIQNLAAEEFLDKFLENMDTSVIDKSILNDLKAWDKKDSKDSLAALVFNKWLYKTQAYLFENIMSKEAFEFMKYKDHYAHIILRKVFGGQESQLVERLGGIQTVLENSYKETIEDLKEKQGGNPANWKWGQSHKLYLKHPLAGASPILDRLFSPEKVKMSGSKYTVMAARENSDDLVNHGASWRFIYDFSTNIGEHIVTPGQSGHFLSDYYDDQIDNWIKGEYTKVDLNAIQVDHTLTLHP